MSSVNKMILLGRIGNEVESKQVGNSMVANFSIATSEKFTDKTGDKKQKTEWHSIVAWGKIAEIAQKYLNKGDQIYLEGKLQTRSWEKDGVTFYKTEIKADNFTMLGSKNSNTSQPSKEKSDDYSKYSDYDLKKDAEKKSETDEVDNLPF